MINNIKYSIYTQYWNGESNPIKSVLEKEKYFLKTNKRYKVINTSKEDFKKTNWLNVGDVWYYGTFYEALKDFDQSNDYFCFIAGDYDINNIENVFSRTEDVLNKYKPYSYSFYTTTPEECLVPKKSSFIGNFEHDELLHYSVIQDGVFVFYHKNIINDLLKYFHYLNNQNILSEIKRGWGIDIVATTFCIQQNGYLLRDSHKDLSGLNIFMYADVDNNLKDCKIFIDNFITFCNKNKEYKDCVPILYNVLSKVGISKEINKFVEQSTLMFKDFYEQK